MLDRYSKKPTLPCLLCSTRYSELDVTAGDFFVSTMICRSCYEKLQQQPYTVSCFGKPNKVSGQTVTAFGFDPKARECKFECPDRSICRALVQVKFGV